MDRFPPMNYILDDKHNPVPVRDVLVWARWMERSMESKSRIVAQDTLPDGTYISTVFLGINHGFGNGRPILFETMVFPAKGTWVDEQMERYSTWDEAKAGHMKMIVQVLGEKATAYLEKYDVKW